MLQTGPDVTGLTRQEAREARIRFWREKIAGARGSGGTQTDYCRVQGISAGAYFWWKKIITRMDRGAKPVAVKQSAPRGATFLPVAVRGLGDGAVARYVLEIDLGPGRVVRVGERCEAKLLETVVRMIAGLSC